MAFASGTSVVVTGASSGIGRAVAHELAARGARLALVDIDQTRLRDVAASLPNATTHVGDIADLTSVAAATHDIATSHSSVDVLVNNAGVSAAGPIEALPIETIRRTMDVNFWGRSTCARAAAVAARGRCAVGTRGLLQRAERFRAVFAADQGALRRFQARGACIHRSPRRGRAPG